MMVQCTIPAANLQAKGRIIHESVTNKDFSRQNRSVFVLFFHSVFIRKCEKRRRVTVRVFRVKREKWKKSEVSAA